MNTVVRLFKGDTAPFVFKLAKESGASEDLTGLTGASFIVKDTVSSQTAVLSLTIGSGLTVEQPDRIVATLTSQQADGLPVGTFLGQMILTFGTVVRRSELFQVRLVSAMS
jgi:hypothetical protein